MKSKYCYHNGRIKKVAEISISPYDLGVLRGFGVFDVMCTQNGKPFLLDDHWKRLVNSAKELGLKLPVGKEVYEKILQKLLKLGGFSKSTIRTVLTGGGSEDGFSHNPNQETFYILIESFSPLPEKIYQQGAAVITVEYQRHFPQAKITNYVTAIKNQGEKRKRKALELIYIKEGKALEAATSNLFIVRKGKIITAKHDILLGITRKLAIKLAIKRGVPVAERPLNTKELFSAEEVFLTATNKSIVPVVKIDGRKIGKGKVGKITQALMKDFQEFSEKY